MQTVGRNDPCPCGSGMKFKHCCERSDSARGGFAGGIQGGFADDPRGGFADDPLGGFADGTRGGPPGGSWDQSESTPEWLADLKAKLRAEARGDFEGAREAAQRGLSDFNAETTEDFHGLSPKQMHDVLYYPFDSPGIATFADSLNNVPDSPFSNIFMALINAIDEEKPKITKTGNLPRPVCQEIAGLYRNRQTFKYKRTRGPVRSELDFFDLHIVRKVAEIAGLIRKYKKRFVLTKKCRKLLDSGGLLVLYPLLLNVYTMTFNWGYWDGYQRAHFVQSSFLFPLFLLFKHGHEWRSNEYYEDQFLSAFPYITRMIEDDGYRTREAAVRDIFTWRVLCNFLGFLGLAEVERIEGEYLHDDYRIRATPLLAEMVTFHV